MKSFAGVFPCKKVHVELRKFNMKMAYLTLSESFLIEHLA